MSAVPNNGVVVRGLRVVAQRRFDLRKRAEATRTAFVQRVEALDEADFGSTNWQALLNSA